MTFGKPANRAVVALQGGMVMLSVIALLLLLSLLASNAATQLSWNMQTSRHWTQASLDRMTRQQWIVELHRLDVSFLLAGADSVECYLLADACIYFEGQQSSADTWHFVVEPQGPEGSLTPAAGRLNRLSVRGWLRRRVEEPSQVAEVWIEAA